MLSPRKERLQISPPPEETATAPAVQEANILLVDDRPDKLLALETAISDLRQNVICATSGEEALRCLLQKDFAVILLDVNMPIMDGFETAALIRRRKRSEHTPIIFVSAMDNTDTHLSRGYSLGAVDYISAPMEAEILRAKVGVFVELYKKTEQVRQQAEERAQAQAARTIAEAAHRRSTLLADVSSALAASLDYRSTLDEMARLLVPTIADWCFVDLLENDGETEHIRRLTVAHANVEHLAIADGLKRVGTGSDHEDTISRLIRNGEGLLVTELAANAIPDKELPLLPPGAASLMVVPIVSRGRPLGALTFISSDPDFAYHPADLALGEDIARRAALAMDNALLYAVAEDARKSSEAANQSKDRFLAMLSHELRTPLNPILISINALEAHPNLPSEVADAVKMIRRNVELEARLIDDLLDLTRISKGKLQLNLETVDAHGLARTALEICDSDISHKNLRIRTDFRAAHSYIDADPARLQQVFWNLIKNAVKFTPRDGEIAFWSDNEEEGWLTVEVCDSGIGIDPAFLPKIFDAFEQADGRTHGGSGLGLGLAITKSLVDIHRGTITAESSGTGMGATFRVRFPTSTAEAIAAAVPGAPSAPQETSALRILLVDDHEDTNRSLSMLLKKRGHHVVAAHSVASGIEAADGYVFDVLISDIGLPDGSGTDLMETLARTRPICGIALSGYGMDEDIQRSKSAGFTEHITKPVDISRLTSLLHDIAHRCKAAQNC